jgi:hypothetical protein
LKAKEVLNVQNRSGIDPMFWARARGTDAQDSADSPLETEALGSMFPELAGFRGNELQAVLGLFGLLGYYGTIGHVLPSE